MNEVIQILFGLLGGLAIFIFGMNMMSECLQKAAGEKMKTILALLTKNPLLGVLAGALTTAVLQSSSATTVMAIGFVSAGLMGLGQAISIILGANIGTTMTAQIIAFKITDYIYLLIFAGFLISFISKSQKVKNIGSTIFAFGLLFLGIETMGDVMKPLASSPVFTNLIGKVTNIPVLGVLVGTVMTLVVQSSSATIAVLQNFASQAGPDGVTSIIGLAGAIPILLGDNIGTTITALLASVGQSKDAKRTALAHCVFNVTGSILFLVLLKPYVSVIQWISPKGPEVEVISRQIANAHTGFNLTMTLIWLPLIWLLVKIVMFLIPGDKEEENTADISRYLDINLLGSPAAALELVGLETLHCCSRIRQLLKKLQTVDVRQYIASLPEIEKEVEMIDTLTDKINEYLTNMFSAGVLTEEQANQTAGLMHVLGDLDRLALLCKDFVMEVSVQDAKTKGMILSKEAIKELQKCFSILDEMYDDTIKMLLDKDVDKRNKIIKKREKIMDLIISMRKKHVERVGKGKCNANMTKTFNHMLNCVNRMGNCCTNISDVVVESDSFEYFSGE